MDVSFFETTIRVMGGLAAAYDLSGDEMFLRKEREIGDALSWAFNTSSGIPYATINLQQYARARMIAGTLECCVVAAVPGMGEMGPMPHERACSHAWVV